MKCNTHRTTKKNRRRCHFIISQSDQLCVFWLPSIIIENKIEPRHEISNNVVCATSKGSDQPAHTHSLIRAFASRLNIL